MGSLFRRPDSKNWYMRYNSGRRDPKTGRVKFVSESSGTSVKARAQALLAKREAEIDEGKPPAIETKKKTFNDLAKSFLLDYKINQKKSLERAGFSVARLEEFFGGWRAHEITTHLVERYKLKRLEDGVKNATINRELAALRRMFSLSQEEGTVTSAPKIRYLTENNVRDGFLEPKEFYGKLLQELPDYLKPVANFGYLTGWRRSEILGLTWDRVNLETGKAYLAPGTTKNKKGRTVFLLPVMIEALQAQKDALRQEELQAKREGKILSKCPYVFHNNRRPIKCFRGSWKSACKAAGFPGLLFHDLRRSAVRNLIRAGISQTVAKEISGHKSGAVFERYNITSEQDLMAARDMLGVYLQGLDCPEIVTVGQKSEVETVRAPKRRSPKVVNIIK